MSWVLVLLVVARSGFDILTDTRVLVPSLTVPALVGALILALAAAVFGWEILRKRSVVHPLFAGWAFWLTYLLFSVAVGFWNLGGAGMGGAREWVRLLTIGAVFALALSVFRNGASRRRALDLLFLALPVPLIAAAGQWLFRKGHVISGRHRVAGTMAHPNSLGLFLVFFIGLTFWKYRTTKRWPWLLLVFLELFLLAKTVYLGGFFMLAILLAVFFIREKGRGKVRVASFAVFFALTVLSAMDSRERMKEIKAVRPDVVNTVLKGDKSQGSFAWRIDQWFRLMEIWAEKPVLGHGLHATVIVNPLKRNGVGFSPHNDYLRYLVETGAVGLLVFFAFLAFTGFRILRAYRSAREPDVKDLLFTLMGVFAAWLVGSGAGNVMNMTSSQFSFWLALGLAFGLAEGDRPADAGREGRRSSLTFVYPLEPGGRKIGGIETFIRGLAASLPDAWQVRIAGVAMRGSALRCGTWHELDLNGRRILFFPVIRIDDPNRRTRIPLFLRFSLGLVRWRSRLDLEGRILSFHHLEPALALAGVKADRLFFVHGDIRDTFSADSESRWKKISWVYRGLERLVIRSMRRIFVVNQAGSEDYRRRYPKVRDRVTFMPAAFDPRIFFARRGLDRREVLARHGVTDHARIILFVGRLEEQKSPFLLLDSFERILRTFPDAVLLVVGQGLLEDGLKERAHELGIDARIFWLGALGGREVSELMNVATMLLLTSAFEGMPRVVMEALACGLPVVSTDAGDVGLVVRDGANGRIVRSRDPEAIAAAAVDVLKAPPRFDPEQPPISDYALDKVLRMVFDELERARNDPS